MGKAKKAGRGRPPTKKLIQPTILEAGLYPAITRPMSLIGRHINVPGSYWPSQGQNRAELVTLYQCVVTDYTSVHVFPGGKSTPAWRMQEMGVTGTGSLENGPCSGDIFWMPQSDLVPFFWKTYPEEMPLPAGSSTTLNDVGTSSSAGSAQPEPDKTLKCHSEFPTLGISTAAIFFNYKIVSHARPHCSDTHTVAHTRHTHEHARARMNACTRTHSHDRRKA